MTILSVHPDRALPGGIIRVNFKTISDLSTIEVRIGGVQAEILAASPSFVTFRVPVCESGELSIICNSPDGSTSGDLNLTWNLNVGKVVADQLHPVSNPVVDAEGNVYVTYSGARGEDVPFGVYVIGPGGTKEPFLGDIANPTGLAIGPDNMLYISSRHTGTVYRSSFDKQVEKFVDGLGIASGVAFDSRGNLFVGDRGGNLFKVAPDGEVVLHCELEPSVSAYHLAVDRDDNIFVTGPTLATQDCVYKVKPDGDVEVFFKGLGRPQGLTIGPSGTLFVAGSYRGVKGVYSLLKEGPHLQIASPILVGLAFSRSGERLYLVDNEQLYSIVP